MGNQPETTPVEHVLAQARDRRTICLLLTPVIFSLVSIFNVVSFGMVTVEQAFTALRKPGPSSPPEAFKVHDGKGGKASTGPSRAKSCNPSIHFISSVCTRSWLVRVAVMN